ncbi:flagellar protein FlaG [Massilia sp. DWR3-1-1]|uniref:flagellar protein FlaG n=1 Tax=Massilia sp. DWR3-1-1 TaxID=2804559 RepID=UPI003CEB70CA
MDIRSVSSSPAPSPVERDPNAVRAAAAAAAGKLAASTAPAPVAAAAATRAPEVRAAGAPDPLDEAVGNINKSLQAAGQGVEFSIDDDSKRLVVKVIDQETREVLRQMPSVEALEIAKALDRAKGMLIKQEA